MEIIVETTPLEKEIASVLNKYSAENPSGTPDFILAQYLINCLHAFNGAVRWREKWYGRNAYFRDLPKGEENEQRNLG